MQIFQLNKKGENEQKSEIWGVTYFDPNQKIHAKEWGQGQCLKHNIKTD